MRFLSLIFFVGALLWASTVFSQDELSSLQVRCEYDSGAVISDKVFTLYQGKDSITSAITNENGEFIIELKLEFSTEYELIEYQKSDSYPSTPMKFETTVFPFDYIIEMTLSKDEPNQFKGQIAYYQPKNIKKIEEFEVEQILSIIEAHPEICIQFSQTIVRSESLNIANKRKANFLKFLEENGVEMSCIQFEEEPRFLRAFDEDQRSRIQGAISSMDSKCN